LVESKSLAAAQKYIVDQLARVGVTEAQSLAKTMRDKVEGLDLDDIVALSGDLKSIQTGSESAATLFPSGRAEPAKMDLKDKLKAQVESAPKVETKSHYITVKPGEQPFTYYTNDGMGEYLTSVDGDQKSCNCGMGAKHGICPNIQAVESFVKAVN
jgi:hypothetical protein